jgi:hypothetical protein
VSWNTVARHGDSSDGVGAVAREVGVDQRRQFSAEKHRPAVFDDGGVRALLE